MARSLQQSPGNSHANANTAPGSGATVVVEGDKEEEDGLGRQHPSLWQLPQTRISPPPGHRVVEQPYDADCTWTVDPGEHCRGWKVSSIHDGGNHHEDDATKKKKAKLRKRKHRRPRPAPIAHYVWWRQGREKGQQSNPPTKGALILVHGLGSTTFFQFLQRTKDSERHHRGLCYEGSFIQKVEDLLQMPCYGLDMEGHGYSRPNIDETPMYMPTGVQGVTEDVLDLMDHVRHQHGWEDYSKLFLVGHSTGCLAITRAVQLLEQESGGTTTVGGIVSTGPLYGTANVNGTEHARSELNWFAYGSAVMALSLVDAVSPKMVLATSYTTQEEDERDNDQLGVHPTIVQKSISPGCLIERGVAGDRDLDPLFHSPYTPIYPTLALSVVRQLRKLRASAGQYMHAPLLVVHSRYDPVVSFDASKRFFNAVASTDKELWSPDEFMMLHNTMVEEEGRDAVQERIFKWIQERSNNSETKNVDSS